MARPKNLKGGRPLIPIDERQLETLSKLHLSDQAIAQILGIHVDTLHNRFSEKMKQWKTQSTGKIANVLFDEALNKRKDYAVKLLANKHLGYFERVQSQTENINYNLNADISETELDQVLNETMKALKSSDAE